MPPFSLDDDGGDSSGEELITASVKDLKVSDQKPPEEVPSGKVLYDQEDETLHGCAMYASNNPEDGTVVLAMDFHGERNVTSIGIMSNMTIAKKVAGLLAAEHHAAQGEHPSCKFFSDTEESHHVVWDAARGDEDS